MNKGVLTAIILGVLIALGGGSLFLLGNGSSDETNTEETSEFTKETEYSLSLDNYFYLPNKITAEPGEKLVLRLNVEGGMHDFKIDELNVQSKTIEKGDQDTVEFIIPKDADTGKTYEFYCSIGNHKQLGMKGTITVK